MAEYTSESMTLAGCEIEVLKGGEGPPLVFLHGAGGAHNWMPYMDRLAEHHKVYIPSHPGWGRSDTPDWLDGMGDLAYFYLDFLDAVGEDGARPSDPPPTSRHREERLRKIRHTTNAATPTAAPVRCAPWPILSCASMRRHSCTK